MNTDFRMRVGWSSHPKFMKLELRLGEHGVLSFIRLLEWTAANKPDGALTHMDAEDISLAARYKGDGDFAATLVSLRLLDQTGDTYSLHDWAEHNPFAAGADDRKRQAEFAVAVRWENDRRRQSGLKPMNESEKATFRIQWECPKPQEQYCENTGSINQNTDSNTPSYPTSPTIPTEPTKEPPIPPVGGVDIKSDPLAQDAYSEFRQDREFPRPDPGMANPIKHLLWRVETSNGALMSKNAAGSQVKAAKAMLDAGFSEDEIIAHYEYQRDRRDTPYNLVSLEKDIGSLHNRKPGETTPPPWMNKVKPDARTQSANPVNIADKYAHLQPKA